MKTYDKQQHIEVVQTTHVEVARFDREAFLAALDAYEARLPARLRLDPTLRGHLEGRARAGAYDEETALLSLHLRDLDRPSLAFLAEAGAWHPTTVERRDSKVWIWVDPDDERVDPEVREKAIAERKKPTKKKAEKGSVVLAVILAIAALGAGLATGCSTPATTEIRALTAAAPCPPVSASYDGDPLEAGDVVEAEHSGTLALNLRNGLSVCNGLSCLRYGAHVLDVRNTGVVVENHERPFDVCLSTLHTDHESVNAEDGCVDEACHFNGKHLHDAMWTWYCDASRWATAGVAGDADRVRVLEASDEAASVSFEWDDVAMNPPAPVLKDGYGRVVYVHNTDTPALAETVRIWKTVRLERCATGYRSSIRSIPALPWPEQGERGMNLGLGSTVVAWRCDGTGPIARHPTPDGSHVDLGIADCVAHLTVQNEGHNAWPFVVIMRTKHPTRWTSKQYGAGQLGAPGPDELVDRVGPDGRPEAWQVTYDTAEYVSADVALEPTPAVRALVAASLASAPRWPD